jgi:branched-chain amino acid transport system permease protein
MELWITQLFNGISYGALLFLLAGGLSLIFGMMRIVNMTHGSYHLLGGYVGLTVISQSGHFLLAILACGRSHCALGVIEWSVFLRRLGGQELGQVLTTMGIVLIFSIWSGGVGR